MYADKIDQEDVVAPPNESAERPPTPEEQPSSPSRDRTPRSNAVINILLLGPSGSGKTSLYNMFSDGDLQPVSGGTGLCTTHFRTSRIFTIGERAFRLIDSPGFHTTSLSDSDLFKKLILYLAKPRDYHGYRKPPPLCGILYLHPEENDLGDDQLKRTIESLKHLVGEPWLSSVTIAIVGDADSDTVDQLQEPSSPFYSLRSGGAKILPLSLDKEKIEDALLGFGPDPPPSARLFQKVWVTHFGRVDGVERFIEEITGPHRKESTGKTGRTRITFEESETTRKQLQTTLDDAETEMKSLRSQLEQTQLEYASLRSELQLHDNTEQSKIVQSLQDLNRAIDDFGRSVAEYMVDNFASSFNKDEPTTLDASDFTELQRQFEHQEGKSSLAASSKGDGLPIEDLIDLALRNFLCQRLCKDVFIPFHPTLATSAEPGFMASLYEEVRRQASPIVAAKWRAGSFTALSKGNKLDKPTIESQIGSLVTEDIQPLLNNLFGPEKSVTLTESQRSQLQDVVNVAWELNHVLKGEVVTLGDFQPLRYECGVPFNPKTMLEFEANKKRKPGDVAICTIRLGLTLSYSKAGKNASPLVVCPATVVTPTVYG